MIVNRLMRILLLTVLALTSHCTLAEEPTSPEQAQAEADSANDGDSTDWITRGERNRCDRSLSRGVRTVLHESVYPVLEKSEIELKRTCPFHKDNDLIEPQESQKRYYRPTGWKCLMCNKMFKTEDFMDAHMDRRHSDKLPVDRHVCLGDYCDMFDCKRFIKKKDQKKKGRSRRLEQFKNKQGVHCRESDMKRKRHRCQHLFQKCLEPTLSDERHKLNQMFSKAFCDQFSCHVDAQSASTNHLPETRMPAGRKVYYILSGFMVLILVIFYVAVYLYRRDMNVLSDLRRLRSERHDSKLMFWKRRTKLKGY